MQNAQNETRTDKVGEGYGRPPVHSRWKKGQSGNRRGRRRGRPNVSTVAKQMLDRKVKLRVGEKTLEMPFLEALVVVHATKAQRGNAKSISAMLTIMERLGYLDLRTIDDVPRALVFRGRMPQNAEEWLLDCEVREEYRRRCEERKKEGQAESNF
jgi:Family of unknown function (DUF5681)